MQVNHHNRNTMNKKQIQINGITALKININHPITSYHPHINQPHPKGKSVGSHIPHYASTIHEKVFP